MNMPYILGQQIDEKTIEETIESIASCIGIEKALLSEFLELSSKHKVLYHGMLHQGSLPRIEERGGIEPRPPESLSSHWTTGLRTFVSQVRPFGKLNNNATWSVTYNTPWFHYCAALITTDYETLEKYGIRIKWEEHDELRIPVTVPLQAIRIHRYEGERRFEFLLDYLRNYR